MQMPPHRFGAGWQKEPAAQQLTDAFDAKGRMLALEFDHLFGDRLRQFGLVRSGRRRLQSGLAKLPIQCDPAAQTALGHPHLGTDVSEFKPFLQSQTNGFELGLQRVAAAQFFPAATPPRGGGVPSSLLLYYGFFIHVNTPLLIGVSTTFSLNSVS